MISTELIETDFPKVSPIALIEQAARMMRDNHLHALPVVDGSMLKGVIACEDIVYRGIASGEDWFLTHVEDFMTRDPIAVSVTDDISDVQALMKAGQHQWLPVVSVDKEYLGVVKLRALENPMFFEQNSFA